MADFIDNLREEQTTVAKALSDGWLTALEAEFPKRLAEAAEKAGMDPKGLDPEAAKEFLQGEHERDVFVAVVGYSTWLATQLFRRHRATDAALKDKEKIPTCDVSDRALIASTYGVETEILERVISTVQSAPNGFVLPGVGVLHRGFVRPKTADLNEWAKHYAW